MEKISSVEEINKKIISNIVFFGEDAFSNIVLQSLINAGYNIQLVVTPYYENIIYKRLEWTCKQNDITFIRCKHINSVELYNQIQEESPDLCVISHFEKLIKKPLLNLPKYGFINLHPALLPEYRGMSPQHWPIINGEKETGITVHYVDETADTGDIICQRRIELTDDMYVSDLQKKWIEEYKTIVIEAIYNISIGAKTIEQRDLKGSYYGKLKVEQCYIDDNFSVSQAYNLVRGVSLPYHGAEYKGIIIYKAHILIDDKAIKDKYDIGIYLDTEEYPFLRLKDGVLVLDKYIDKNERRDN